MSRLEVAAGSWLANRVAVLARERRETRNSALLLPPRLEARQEPASQAGPRSNTNLQRSGPILGERGECHKPRKVKVIKLLLAVW